MGTISKETYQRIFTLYLVSVFRDGVYGLTRLQKTTYQATKELQKNPFTFIRYQHGQFSRDLSNIYEQLLSLGYLTAVPLDTKPQNEGNHITLSPLFKQADLKTALKRIIGATAAKHVNAAIRTVGLLPHEAMLERMYSELSDRGIEMFDIITKENLPEMVDIVNLNDDECENLELVFNPKFVQAMRRITETCAEFKLDTSKMKKAYILGRI